MSLEQLQGLQALVFEELNRKQSVEQQKTAFSFDNLVHGRNNIVLPPRHGKHNNKSLPNLHKLPIQLAARSRTVKRINADTSAKFEGNYSEDPQSIASSRTTSNRHGLPRLIGIKHPKLDLTEVEIQSLGNFHSLIGSIAPTKIVLDSTTNDHFISNVTTPRELKQTWHSDSRQQLNDAIDAVNDMQSSSVHSSACSLDDASTVQYWAASYQLELSTFDSVALFAELRLRELMLAEAAHKHHPSKLKAAVCCDLISKVSQSLGRYSTIIEPLLQELFNSIYLEYGDKLSKGAAPHNVREFYAAPTYFDVLSEKTDVLNDIEVENNLMNQGVAMKDLIKKYSTVRQVHGDRSQFFVRDACFLLWKGYCQERVAKSRQAKRYNLKKFWVRWLQYLMLKTGVIKDRYRIGIRQQFLEDFVDKACEVQIDLFKSGVVANIAAKAQGGGQVAMAKEPETEKQRRRRIRRNSGDLTSGSLAQALSSSFQDFVEIDGQTTATADEDGAQQKSGDGIDDVVKVVTFAAQDDQSTEHSSQEKSSKKKKKSQKKSGKKSSAGQAEDDQHNHKKAGKKKHSSSDNDANTGKTKRNRRGREKAKGGGEGNDDDDATAAAGENQSKRKGRGKKGRGKNGEGDGGGEPSEGDGEQNDNDEEEDEDDEDGSESNDSDSDDDDNSGDDDKLNEEDEENEAVAKLRAQLRAVELAKSDKQDQSCQTPSEWVTINQPAAAAIASAADSFTELRVSSDNKVKASAKENFTRVTVETACQLIASIFEAKVVAARSDPTQFDFEKSSLLEYSKEVLILRYGIKSLAVKNLNGLIICCELESQSNRRLELYASLCGISSKVTERESSADCCTFFFQLLSAMFTNPKMIAPTFNSKSKDIERPLVLDSLKKVFVNMASKDSELLRVVEKRVMELPCVQRTEQAKVVHKVMLDEVLLVLLAFYDLEKGLEHSDGTDMDSVHEKEASILLQLDRDSHRHLTSDMKIVDQTALFDVEDNDDEYEDCTDDDEDPS